MQTHGPSSVLERRGTFVRQLTLWAGMLCILAQFSSALHLLLVEHVRCVEHGEWVHADGEGGDGHAIAHSASHHNEPAFGAFYSEDQHGHEHCLVCSERPTIAVQSPELPELRAPCNTQQGTLLSEATSRVASSVYSFAPKTSPPAQG